MKIEGKMKGYRTTTWIWSWIWRKCKEIWSLSIKRESSSTSYLTKKAVKSTGSMRLSPLWRQKCQSIELCSSKINSINEILRLSEIIISNLKSGLKIKSKKQKSTRNRFKVYAINYYSSDSSLKCRLKWQKKSFFFENNGRRKTLSLLD